MTHQSDQGRDVRPDLVLLALLVAFLALAAGHADAMNDYGGLVPNGPVLLRQSM